MSEPPPPTSLARSELLQLLVEVDDTSTRAYSFMDGHFNKFYELCDLDLKGVVELYISSEMMRDYIENSFDLSSEAHLFEVTEQELMLMANLVVSMKALKMNLASGGISLEMQ